MTLKPLMVAISLAAALMVAVPSAPAAAQQDDRFYGRWEPSSTPAAGTILYMDPRGYLSLLRLNGEFTNKQYEVIRDFGDRLVVRMWGLGNELWDVKTSSLVVLEISQDSGFTLGSRLIVPPTNREFLSYHDCSSPAAQDFFYRDHNPDNIWRRIREWSARSEEGFPYASCGLSPMAGITGESWSTGSWARDIDGDPQ